MKLATALLVAAAVTAGCSSFKEGGGSAGGDSGAATGDGGGSTTRDQTSCAKTGTAGCACNAPDPKNPGAANAVTCDPTIGLGAICCAGSGWPAAGSTCTCFTASCRRPAGGGCDCTLGSAGDTCTDGTVCCVSPFGGDCQCTYQGPTCAEGYRQVTQCDATAIGCGADRRVVSCTIP